MASVVQWSRRRPDDHQTSQAKFTDQVSGANVAQEEVSFAVPPNSAGYRRVQPRGEFLIRERTGQAWE